MDTIDGESEISISMEGRDSKCAKIKVMAKRVLSSDILKPILYGQGLSLLICGTAVTSTYLVEDYNANIPLTQSLCNYTLLALIYGTLFMFQKDENGHRLFIQTLKTVGWKYFVIAIADVLANYLMVSAYQYTSLTSVQVLDCFVIPVVMGLSWFILKTRYKIIHFVGVGIALIGVTFMIVADVVVEKGGEDVVADVLLEKGGEGVVTDVPSEKGGENSSNPLLGDAMVLFGAACYGVSNVGMEYFMKGRPVGHVEVLAMYGIFGTIISGVMAASLERDALTRVEWSPITVAILLGFTVCMFILYTCMPIVMKLSSATTVNLSILTADLYALFAGIFLFGYEFTPLYIVSFIVIFASLIVYNSRPAVSAVTATEERNSGGRQADNCPYQPGTPNLAPEIHTTSFSSCSSNTPSVVQLVNFLTSEADFLG